MHGLAQADRGAAEGRFRRRRGDQDANREGARRRPADLRPAPRRQTRTPRSAPGIFLEQALSALRSSEESRQGRRRPCGARPGIEEMPSVAEGTGERRSADFCRVSAGEDLWATRALVTTAERANLRAGISRRTAKLQREWLRSMGPSSRATVPKPGVERPFLRSSYDRLVFAGRGCVKTLRSSDLKEATYAPRLRRENSRFRRLNRSLMSQRFHRQRFESLARASRAIGGRMGFCNHRRRRGSPRHENSRRLCCDGSLPRVASAGSMRARAGGRGSRSRDRTRRCARGETTPDRGEADQLQGRRRSRRSAPQPSSTVLGRRLAVAPRGQRETPGHFPPPRTCARCRPCRAPTGS